MALQKYEIERSLSLIEAVADLGELSKSKAKSLLNDKRVWVNGKRVWMSKHALKRGDLVEINFPENKSREIELLYEDDYFYIINKPPGVVTNLQNGSLEEVLREKYNNKNLWVVHRLDKDTSGCLIVAKNNKVFEVFKNLFSEQGLNKKYLFLASGNPKEKNFSISNPIHHKTAVSHFKVLDHTDRHCFIEATIETGRKHQIRKHLLEAGHPVLGDKLYDKKNGTEEAKACDRHMLHALELSFIHPFESREITVQSPWPEDFRAVKKLCRL